MDRCEAPEIFIVLFAYIWSLCVGKIQQSLKWLEKNLSQSLKKKAGKTLSRNPGQNFPTGVSWQKFFPSPVLTLPIHVSRAVSEYIFLNQGGP
jgi:hypothetical protein